MQFYNGCLNFAIMSDSYLTISAPAEGIIKEKMSKFMSFAIPVATVMEAKNVIAEFQKRYHDARHVCWAYMIGADRTEYLSSDNGEPSGTAGKPILGQINSRLLTDVVVVVVRYFGGIKLGTSGLISAYKEAASEALDASEIIERHVTKDVEFTFPYLSMNDVMKLCKTGEVEVVEQHFDNSCRMILRTRRDLAPMLIARLKDIDGVSLLTGE